MAKKNGYTASALKQVAYWYKINGKKCSKAAYNAYVNKPGGDEGGKTTNDPDPSGNKAKIAGDRAKLPKKATVLTEAQTKAKKKVKSPLKFGWKDALDAGQTALTAAGMIPAVGNIADGVNAAVSGGRSAYAKYKGNAKDAKKYAKEGAVNLAAMVPGAGLAVGGAKLAAKGAKYAKLASNVNTAKKVYKGGKTTKKGASVVSDVKKGVAKPKKPIVAKNFKSKKQTSDLA